MMEVLRIPGKARHPRGVPTSVCGLVVSAMLVAIGGGCGGTTGKEDLPVTDAGRDTSADALTRDVSLEAGGELIDASTPPDLEEAAAFDVAIQLADRTLPDVVPVKEAAAPDAGGWPRCAPDIPAILDDDGGIRLELEGGVGTWEVPAEFATSGDQVPAAQGSVCAEHPWLGTKKCDQCLIGLNGGSPGLPWQGKYGSAVLPPCSDLANAGMASAGIGRGRSRYDLCVELFTCIWTTRCFLNHNSKGSGGPFGCWCEDGKTGTDCLKDNGPGPCLQEELSAFELPADQYLTFNKLASNLDVPVHGGASVNVLFSLLLQNLSDCQEDCALGPSATGADAGK